MTAHSVPKEDLRTINFNHFDTQGLMHIGSLLVHESIESSLVDILEIAYRIKFPIHKAVLVQDSPYFGNDELSMQDNNSSCFNDRTIKGASKVSMHALGLAVDINPEFNPYLAVNDLWYPNESHLDRSIMSPGMFSADHPIVQAFIERGFEWGGSWDRPDYHHFEFIGTADGKVTVNTLEQERETS